MLSAAAAVSGVVPESIQKAYAIEPEPGSTYLDADHIVILMQENRSFDHALGTLRGVRGFNDPRAIRLANGNSVFVQTDKSGATYPPWRLDIKDTRITWMGSLPHSRESQVDAWHEGLHDGWLEAKRSHNREYADVPMTMGHYTREDIPFYYALADAFTVCDQHYCSAMTSTTPNRCYFWTGTIRDRQSTDSKVYMRNEEIERGGMIWKTYPERLQEAGISWKLYQNELTNSGLENEEDAWLGNFGDNPLESFAAYNIEAYPGFALEQRLQIAKLIDEAAKLKEEISHQKEAQAAANLDARLASTESRFAACQAALAKAREAPSRLTTEQRAVHDAAFVTNAGDPDYHALESLPFRDNGQTLNMNVPKGDIFYEFRKDVNEGKLPAVSWLIAPENFSDHPVSPWYGAWYVSEVMEILTKNPQTWKKTIFILTYDENDGYFDHAPSFVAADPKRPWTGHSSPGINGGLDYTYKEDELAQGVAEEEARTGPIGMGFRVPMIIASPWSRGGWVNSQLFDHTSTLMFLEHFLQTKFGKTVREENISAWRRAISGNLSSAFRPYDAKAPDLDFLGRDKFVVSIQKSRYKEIPSKYQKLNPEQIDDINRNLFHSRFTSHQEAGIRPACALPYELQADGALSADRSSFELAMTASNAVFGSDAAGAPFNVYLRNLKHEVAAGIAMRVATYAVKPGDTLREQFPLSLFADANYSIEVHGPNGFYRSFTGNAAGPNILVRTEYDRNGAQLTGNVKVHLHNIGDKALTGRIQDNSYKTGALTRTIQPGHEESGVLNLKKSHGWYDFTVRVEGSESAAHFAGRVETGRPSFSDPLMGGVV